MTLRVHFLYFLFFLFVILVIPINLGPLRIFNESIFILAIIGAVLFVVFSRHGFGSVEKIVIFHGLVFTVLFSFVLIIHFPVNFLLKDFVEVLKPLLYSIIFISGYRLAKKFSELSIEKTVIYVGLGSVVFSTLVFFPALYSIADLYKGRVSGASYNLHFFRFSGTLGYPGGFGYWLVLPTLVLVSHYHRRLLPFSKFIVLFGFLLFGVVMTGSRGAAAIFFLTLSFYYISNLESTRNFVAVLVFIACLAVSIFAIVNYSESYQSLGYLLSTFDTGSDGSFAHRLNELDRLKDSLLQGRVIGFGPNNYYLRQNYGPVESVYYYYGIKFGFIGLLYYFSLILTFGFVLLRCILRNRRDSFVFVFSVFALANLIVAGVSNAITEEYKSFYIFFMLSGVVVSLSMHRNGSRQTGN